MFDSCVCRPHTACKLEIQKKGRVYTSSASAYRVTFTEVFSRKKLTRKRKGAVLPRHSGQAKSARPLRNSTRRGNRPCRLSN